ncbi:alpha/beta hydrolase family protein [Sphingobacterium sp.]|uniref:alpha/beta hydrolase family protein n=1 Tax=Sphingobacterium sp. TaxID=341027 RepID=UPI002FDB6CB0
MKNQDQISVIGFSTNPVITYSPLVMSVSDRAVDMHLKVSAPVNGTNLPIVILSHGHGASTYLSSLRGLAPLTEFFSSKGFIVIQPTHPDSKLLGLDTTGPEGRLFLKSRAKDIHFILDNLDRILATVPGLENRADKSQVSAIGHSLGALTTGMLAGAEITDNVTGEIISLAEPRLKAIVMIGAPGSPEGLNGDFAITNYPILKGINYKTMSLPTLVINGDKDINLNFSDVENWRADPYYESPVASSLLTIFGAEHIYGGVSGWDVAETSDESPERVAFVCESILAYICSAMDSNDNSWKLLQKDFENDPNAKARIDIKL